MARMAEALSVMGTVERRLEREAVEGRLLQKLASESRWLVENCHGSAAVGVGGGLRSCVSVGRRRPAPVGLILGDLSALSLSPSLAVENFPACCTTSFSIFGKRELERNINGLDLHLTESGLFIYRYTVGNGRPC